ncbi:hypothetical protein HY933_03985 [Candidatus Falkowbacteria bacterium]|nr:hypothetical protein [Candidatus Falkowbacteria bacterium]
MSTDEEKFNSAKNDATRFYSEVGKVFCPYLSKDVHFNTEGLQHLIFKSWNTTRSQDEQYIRLRLLPLAVRIIKKSATLQEYCERNMLVRQKINSRWEKRMKLVRYYVFIAVMPNQGVRLKVVVKEVMVVNRSFGVFILLGRLSLIVPVKNVEFFIPEIWSLFK